MITSSVSNKNLRIRSSSQKKLPPPQSLSPSKKFDHKKQIQATLNELHQLQAQIYSLNVPQNPHSSGPTKKQIKQLSYLYESMTKPKVKNRLNISLKEIKSAIKVMNQGMNAIQEKCMPKIKPNKAQQSNMAKQISLLKQFTLVEPQQQEQLGSKSIPSKTLKQMMKSLYQTDFDLSLVSETKTSRAVEISAQQIEKFINYNEFDNFDPLLQAYNSLLDDNGRFSFKRYNEINKIFGLPVVKELAILKQSIGIKQGQDVTFEDFKRIMTQGEELGFV